VRRSAPAALVVLTLAGVAGGEPLAPPSDPLFKGRGAWKQKHEDQWAIRRVGFTDGADSAWRLVDRNAKPVVVAVVDTGLDWNHLEIDPARLWRNPKETPDNAKDDDGNGLIDDVIGWNFVGDDPLPWDHVGHGTIVTGIIAARWNDAGIAGIDPFARIMVLKALNDFGHTRASSVAQAIVYAADHGARVVNVSVAGKGITELERRAIEHAVHKGALVVVAAGNDGKDVADYGPAGLESVITVTSTMLDDERAPFSNWGRAVDLAAPGFEVLSLRARHTDTVRDLPGSSYKAGSAYVGKDRRYYRASGTSFSAPIVTATASLLMASKPSLAAQDVKRVLLQSARDVGTPGIDQYTGYGLLDARAALAADPRFFVEAAIDKVAVAGNALQVLGRADADAFAGARIELGAGEAPESWKTVVAKIEKPVREGVLGSFPTSELAGQKIWMLRLVVRHKDGREREARFRLSLS
jgi:subtilisin family serine protease